MVTTDKTENECKIDFACPFDSIIEERKKGKIKRSKERIEENIGYASESNLTTYLRPIQCNSNIITTTIIIIAIGFRNSYATLLNRHEKKIF